MTSDRNRAKKNCPVCGEPLSSDQTCDACGFVQKSNKPIISARTLKIVVLVILVAGVVLAVVYWAMQQQKTVVDGHYKLLNYENSVVYVNIDSYPQWKELSDKISEQRDSIRILEVEKKNKFSILEEERRIERLILNRKNTLHALFEEIKKLEKTDLAVSEED